MGLGQYNSLGEYCGPHTACPVFLILLYGNFTEICQFLQMSHFTTRAVKPVLYCIIRFLKKSKNIIQKLYVQNVDPTLLQNMACRGALSQSAGGFQLRLGIPPGSDLKIDLSAMSFDVRHPGAWKA